MTSNPTGREAPQGTDLVQRSFTETLRSITDSMDSPPPLSEYTTEDCSDVATEVPRSDVATDSGGAISEAEAENDAVRFS